MNDYTKNILALVLLLNLGCAAKASEIGHIQQDLGFWPQIDLTVPLYKNRLSGYLMVLPIINDLDNQMNVSPVNLRGALIFHPNQNTGLWLGLDNNLNATHQVNFVERRVWQQLSHNHKLIRFPRITLKGRLRAEERFFEHTGLAIRLRARGGLTIGLGKTEKWYLIGQDEMLFYANSTIGREAGFSENRFYIGLGRKINRYLSVELAYQNSLINSANNIDDLARHFLVTYFKVRLPRGGGSR